jgi:FdhE protein
MLFDLDDVVSKAMQLFTELQELKKEYVPQIVQTQPSFSEDQWKDHREKGILLFKFQKPVIDEGLCLRLASDICDCIMRNRSEIKDQVESVRMMMDRVSDGFFLDFLQNDHKVSSTELSFSPQEEKLINFIVWQALSPFLEKYVSLLPQEVGDDQWQHGHCPVCGVMPNFSYLRQEDGKRYLICPFCGQEWLYRYLACPWCGNDDHKGLSYLEVVELPGYEVYTCDQCHSYLKTYNARKAASHDDWALEDVKTLALDLIAQKRGYNCPGKQMM